MASTIQTRTTSNLRKVLLVCGIIAALVWVGTDIVASNMYVGYNPISQATSELFAIGAPTSGFVVTLFTLYDALLVAFAFGVWICAGKNRSLRIVALMLAGLAATGLALWPFFPMHMRGSEATFTDVVHLTIAGIGTVFALLSVGFGIVALGKGFKYFSIAAIIGLVVPGILAFLYAPQVAANQSTPFLGLNERIAQYVNALWVFVLSVVLLQRLKQEHLVNMPDTHV